MSFGGGCRDSVSVGGGYGSVSVVRGCCGCGDVEIKAARLLLWHNVLFKRLEQA